MKFSIDTRKTVSENADYYYKKSKKAKQKVRGAEKALEKTLERIGELEKKEYEKDKIPEKKKEKRKTEWYEKFRFFHSSDSYLVIGGKDASTNELLIKKHMEGSDLVFHSDIQGAPFFIVKNPDKGEIPESTRIEAAQAAASYSRAWTAGYGAVDVYSVKPEQVSKNAPSGEYLAKGSFMIYGRKIWYRKTLVGIAVGFKLNDYAEVLGGPVDSVKKNSNYFVELTPGNKKSKTLAEEVKKKILSKAKKEYIDKIDKVDLQEIQKWIPSGKGRIKKR